MSAKKEIENIISSISGKYSPYEVFSDWIRACAISVQNQCVFFHDKTWEKREQTYKDTVRRYTDPEVEKFAEMFVLLGDALTEQMEDVLGSVYMEMGMGSKTTGQFFTPFHLSELTSTMSIHDSIKSFDGKMTLLNEPSCGGGGMIIAAAKTYLDHGINPQKYLRILAQDLDWKAVYMCYLQLSLLGLKATVVQGDTLCEPYKKGYPADRVMRTPAEMGLEMRLFV